MNASGDARPAWATWAGLLPPEDFVLSEPDHVDVPAVREPSLVSVLLPANSSANPDGPGLTAIDEIYVVILNPQNTFSTYACQLPNKRALVV